uniref:dihydropyrimidine dehydrogenase (NADP(+)) n=1 Tax=Polytomella parva TaxID=51329 RepID=A0A7S0VCA2_9CHLO|nr:dihydropyrimidine dehydrogenase [NADP(+)] (DPYD) [Polytomella parva]|eukprot:CAMPEP_0175056014 /NCGR_PEP_ID=MMETSP0052_2-20121109/10420_1 /TAXON_ID=51329 ORGANISM="Polytomella parva, Strain SAG 63-3" /NCGR_SAMPLE_ID=MMETSP0052_2 /ASSEMBLY_ACC=CAM_ASM_000194 /LENGTH=420 /DNA_ID=CAMNT_0016320963 /DNA_START=66 /DNA_END=1328 /DNA_ORIENTATION=+
MSLTFKSPTIFSHKNGFVKRQSAAYALPVKKGALKTVQLVNGKPINGPDLSVEVNGLKLPNPFIIGSGPPGTNYQVMKKAFDEGWGGVICKTLSLDASKVINVTPRYAKLRDSAGKVFGWENFELISDRSFEVMLAELKRLKQEYPDRVLIASIMEEVNKSAWEEIIGRCEEVGVDAFEINFSCPHGMPERKMGMAMGQDCELLTEVCTWINAAATKPVWAKMTPNITDITQPALCALNAGCEGVAAINTIQSVMGINLETLRPEPCVEGYSTSGGYSYKAVKPIALAKVMSIAHAIEANYKGQGHTLSGIGGIETGEDAAEFILAGSDTVQVCTGVMIHGYPLVKNLCAGLQDFMRKHDFKSIAEFKGKSLPYFTTHSDLVRRQRAALKTKRERKGLSSDADWSGDNFVQNADSMVANS